MAFLAGLAAASEAYAQPPVSFAQCPLQGETYVPFSKAPSGVVDAFTRSFAPFAVEDEPFDETDVSNIGIRRGILWTRGFGNRWAVAVGNGGLAYYEFTVIYELDVSGGAKPISYVGMVRVPGQFEPCDDVAVALGVRP